MWNGRAPASKAHREFVIGRAIAGYQSAESNLSVRILEQTESDVARFITLTFRKGMESIKGFAGRNGEVPRYYPEDKDFLLEFEPTVVHYEAMRRS